MADDSERIRNIVAITRRTREDIRTAQTNGDLELLTEQHPDLKKAAAAKALAEFIKDPLVKDFIRRKPKVYVLSKDAPAGATIKFRFPEKYYIGAAQNNIIMSDAVLETLSIRGIRASIAHELSHILRLDSHIKRDIYPDLTNENRLGPHHEKIHEQLADKLEVYLTGDAAACKNSLRSLARTMMEELQEQNPLKDLRPWKEAMDDDIDARCAMMDATADRIATSEGRIAVESELRAAYLSEHQRLFPGQFSRQLANTRLSQETHTLDKL